MNVAYNMDCMEYMKTLPDNAFDLAVVDPPYGDGCSQSLNVERERRAVQPLRRLVQPIQDGAASDNGSTGTRRVKRGVAWQGQIPSWRTGGQWASKYGKKIIAWDVAPKDEYFTELFRISRNQIIWGGNYFDLPPTRCFLIWRKLTISDQFSMAMVEYAWTSFNENAKCFEFAPQGKKTDQRFHPTQKPVELYRWIYKNYAKQGDKILDTHLGSGSSRIAAWDAGLDFVGTEIDETYFKLEEERFAKHIAQGRLFDNPLPSAEQTSLF